MGTQICSSHIIAEGHESFDSIAQKCDVLKDDLINQNSHLTPQSSDGSSNNELSIKEGDLVIIHPKLSQTQQGDWFIQSSDLKVIDWSTPAPAKSLEAYTESWAVKVDDLIEIDWTTPASDL